MGWQQEAFEEGARAAARTSTAKPNIPRIFADPNPTNWVKWWKRGYEERTQTLRYEAQDGLD